MEESERSPARIVAPIALVVFGIAALIIIASAGGSGKSESSSRATSEERRALKLGHGKRSRTTETRTRTTASHPGVYVVKSGDTLGSIAAKTGVSVEKLQELNPTLDPQALQSGQRVKLR